MATAPVEIEVFAAGPWLGLDWTGEHLDQAVANFHALKDRIKPPLKLGHDAKQILAQKDGQPALGWLSNLRREGEKLIATVEDMPGVIRQAIEKRLYRRVSPELYRDWERTGTEQKLKTGRTGTVITAVSLLGADAPEIKTLADLQAYLATEGVETVLHASDAVDAPLTPLAEPAPLRPTRNHPQEGPMADDLAAVQAELKKLTEAREKEQAERAAEKAVVESKLSEIAVQRAKDETEIARLTEENKQARERERAAHQRATQAEASRFCEERMRKGNLRMVPAQQAPAQALFRMLAGIDSVKLTATEAEELKLFAEGETKRDLSPLALFTRVIDAMPDQSMLLKELSQRTDPAGETFDDALKAIAMRDKLDLTKPADLKAATLKTMAEKPELSPKYGSAAIYGGN